MDYHGRDSGGSDGTGGENHAGGNFARTSMHRNCYIRRHLWAREAERVSRQGDRVPAQQLVGRVGRASLASEPRPQPLSLSPCGRRLRGRVWPGDRAARRARGRAVRRHGGPRRRERQGPAQDGERLNGHAARRRRALLARDDAGDAQEEQTGGRAARLGTRCVGARRGKPAAGTDRAGVREEAAPLTERAALGDRARASPAKRRHFPGTFRGVARHSREEAGYGD
mmetsp:Transcript_18947/g.40891  ORF Transcript_18947/g.40891 Transcript_18947/m.40891 type:complete len:226 (-) Transcript_18947:3300-3977(-)